MKRNTPNPNTIQRRGFTLLELMVVVVIIGILLALLLPALAAVRRNVRIAQVRTEIAGLESALADFKATYGVYPPSRITLPGTSAPTSWNNRDRALLRQIWPQFSFASTPNSGSSAVTLTGAECLVFFLGGMADASGAMTGFSKNPANPFATGGNRVGPFFTFDTQRLADSERNDSFQVYLDPLPSQSTPYLYLNSYDGQGYDTADLAVFASGGNMTSAYRQGATTASFFNPKTFQIISPGFDTEYGEGGVYNPNATDALSGDREAERDNITNFHNGTLAN